MAQNTTPHTRLSKKMMVEDHQLMQGRNYIAPLLHKNDKDILMDDSLNSEQDDKNFPFILNDIFGYVTHIVSEGCYQILVPR